MLAGLKDKLLAPELLEVFVAEFLKEWNAASRDGEAAWAASRRELAETERKIEAILKAIEDGIYTAATKDRLLALEARKAELAAMAPPQPAPRIHPNLAEVYRRKVEKLEEALNEPDLRQEAAEPLRGLIEKIVLTPGAGRGEMRAAPHGELGALLALGEAGIKNRTPGVGVRLSVVCEGARPPLSNSDYVVHAPL